MFNVVLLDLMPRFWDNSMSTIFWFDAVIDVLNIARTTSVGPGILLSAKSSLWDLPKENFSLARRAFRASSGFSKYLRNAKLV